MNDARARFPVFCAVLALAAVILAACDSNDNPATPDFGEYVWVHHDGDSLRVYLDDLPFELIDGDLAVVYLHHLVSAQLVPPVVDGDGASHDTRRLYSYEIVGEDGFSAHGTRGYPNNTWDQLPLGYIRKADRRVIFPDEAIDLPGAYNVKETRHIHFWRKFDLVLAAADTTVFYELRDMPVVTRPNADSVDENAIDLTSFVEQLVADEHLADPSAHVYDLTAVDGYTIEEPVTWTQLATGYWLLESQRTRFSDPDLQAGQYRQRHLEKITVQTP